jgi:hypothetical protein
MQSLEPWTRTLAASHPHCRPLAQESIAQSLAPSPEMASSAAAMRKAAEKKNKKKEQTSPIVISSGGKPRAMTLTHNQGNQMGPNGPDAAQTILPCESKLASKHDPVLIVDWTKRTIVSTLTNDIRHFPPYEPELDSLHGGSKGPGNSCHTISAG